MLRHRKRKGLLRNIHTFNLVQGSLTFHSRLSFVVMKSGPRNETKNVNICPDEIFIHSIHKFNLVQGSLTFHSRLSFVVMKSGPRNETKNVNICPGEIFTKKSNAPSSRT